MTRRLVVFAVIVLALALALVMQTQQPTAAQTDPTQMRTLLERLSRDGTAFTIQFAAPFIAGETLVGLPGDARRLAEIGDDYLCISQPWNDGSRVSCTPYTNIVGITFTQ